MQAPWLIAALIATLPAASVFADDLRIRDARVKSHGFDTGGEFCSDFSLTDGQAREFFRRASKLKPDSYHRSVYLPCYVQGTGRQGGQSVDWEIRAGGTGFIKTSKGETILISCGDACDHLFK
jgi:hypothetical protein